MAETELALPECEEQQEHGSQLQPSLQLGIGALARGAQCQCWEHIVSLLCGMFVVYSFARGDRHAGVTSYSSDAGTAPAAIVIDNVNG